MRTNRLFETALRCLAAALCCCACTKEVEFRDKETDPRLVINCVVTAGEPVCFSVGKSVFFLSDVTNTSAPEGLAVTLLVNGSEISGLTVEDDTIGYTNGSAYHYSEDGQPIIHKLFRSAYVAKEGDEVRVKASAPGFEPAEGSCILQPFQTQFDLQHNITSLHIDSTSSYYDSVCWVDAEIAVKVRLTDPHPGVRDYYLLQIQPKSQTLREGSYDHGKYLPSIYWNIYAYSDDPVFQQMRSPLESEPGGESALSDRALFTDLLFDGKEYTLNLTLKFHGFLDDSLNDVDFDIEISQLDRNLYQYYCTCRTNGGMMGDLEYFFSEPVQTFSNISKGYGIIGSANRKKGHVHLKAF